MKIYLNSDTCRWILDEANITYNQVNTILDSDISMFHVPFPYVQQFELDIDHAVTSCKKVIIVCSELHDSTVDFIKRYQDPKIVYFTCGFIEGVTSYKWMDWFINTTYFYKNNPEVLEQLHPFDIKPKMFDVLLGQQRSHRDFIYNNINQTNNIVTYIQKRGNIQTLDTNSWIWELNNLELPNYDFNHTITTIKFHGHEMSLSQVIPFNIYNQTAYSVVAETNHQNGYSFFTEKIVKPILAQRLFVVFSGQFYLKNLREFGFKTFDDIIDESYDTIEDNNTRFKSVLKQIEYLYTQPQDKILSKIQPIVEHNKTLMLDTDWLRNFTNQLSFLTQKL